MTMTAADVTTIEPLTHQEAMRLQAGELRRTLGLRHSLDERSWAAATDCPAWDIRAMYQHVLGACEAGASVRENIRQLRRARAYRRRHGGPLEAALSAVQVSERAGLSPAQITRRLEAVALAAPPQPACSPPSSPSKTTPADTRHTPTLNRRDPP